MIIKAVTVFLIGMAVLAMFGRFRFPGQTQLENRKCKSCGRYKLGRGPCTCQSDKG